MYLTINHSEDPKQFAKSSCKCSALLNSAQRIENNITKPSLFKYTEYFTTKKWKRSDENSDIFHISAQNIDCVYSLEPPRSNEYL